MNYKNQSDECAELALMCRAGFMIRRCLEIEKIHQWLTQLVYYARRTIIIKISVQNMDNNNS